MSAATSAIFSTPHEAMPSTHSTEWRTHDERLQRWRPSLHLVACRILPDPEMAAYAVENCLRKATRNPPRLGSRGAFGSWIMRLLISEALPILHQSRIQRSL